LLGLQNAFGIVVKLQLVSNGETWVPIRPKFFEAAALFDDGLHAPIADTRTKLLTHLNHSKPTIAFNKVTNRDDIR
jgi:hypothetical protein